MPDDAAIMISDRSIKMIHSHQNDLLLVATAAGLLMRGAFPPVDADRPVDAGPVHKLRARPQRPARVWLADGFAQRPPDLIRLADSKETHPINRQVETQASRRSADQSRQHAAVCRDQRTC